MTDHTSDTTSPAPGRIVILNGVPRSGKSSIVRAIQETFDGPWMNLGVDMFNDSVTPQRFIPGIGLRPGAGRADLEPFVQRAFAALYASVAAHSRIGFDVVVDVGHHDAYTRPLGVLSDAARRLAGLPVLFVGVRCPIEVIMERRNAGQPKREGVYATSAPGGAVPSSVQVWQREVHRPGIYDLDLDTSVLTPPECAQAIRERLDQGPARSVFHGFASAP